MNIGGVERSFLSLSEALTQRGHKVTILTLKKNKNILEPNTKAIQLISLNKNRALYSVKNIANIINNLKPDVFISAQYYANIVAIISSKLASEPTFTILSERLHLTRALEEYGFFKRKILSFLIKKTYKKANLIYGNSDHVCEDLIENYTDKNTPIIKILNPALFEKITYMSKEKVADPWVTEDKIPILLYVGRLSPQKDIPTLLNTYKLLSEKIKVKLLIIGEGPQKILINEFINNNPKLQPYIKVNGFELNPYKYFRHSTVLLLTSKFEGLPNVLIEGQILQIPIVATDSPGGTSEVLENGKSGVLAKVGDHVDIARKIEGLLTDENKKKSIIENMSYSSKRFNSLNIADRLIKEIVKAK